MTFSRTYKNGFTIQYFLKPLKGFSSPVVPFFWRVPFNGHGWRISVNHSTDLTNATYYMQVAIATENRGNKTFYVSASDIQNELFSGTNIVTKDRYLYHQISYRRPYNSTYNEKINIRIGYKEDYEDKYVEVSKSFKPPAPFDEDELLDDFSSTIKSEVSHSLGCMVTSGSSTISDCYRLYNFRLWGENADAKDDSTVGFITHDDGTISEKRFKLFLEQPSTIYMKNDSAYDYLTIWAKLDGNFFNSGSEQYAYNTAPSDLVSNLKIYTSGSSPWVNDEINEYEIPNYEISDYKTDYSKVRYRDEDINNFVDTNILHIIGDPANIFNKEFNKYFSKYGINIAANRDELLYSSSFETMEDFRDNIASKFNFNEDFFNYTKCKKIYKKVFSFLPDFLKQFIPERVELNLGLLLANPFYKKNKWPVEKPTFDYLIKDYNIIVEDIEELNLEKIDTKVTITDVVNETISSETQELIVTKNVTNEIVQGDIENTNTYEGVFNYQLQGTAQLKDAIERRIIDNIFVKKTKKAK